MAVIKCKMCGGNLEISAGLTVAACEYCGTLQTVPTVDNEEKRAVAHTSYNKQSQVCSQISLSEDVARLLQKCEADRKNARKYANLVLDIDPDNTDALKYLK